MKNYEQEERYLRAKRKLDKIKGFHGHLVAYVIINIFLVLFFTYSSGGWSPKFLTTALFWGIGLGIHALSVFGADFMLGRNWEERKLQEFLEEEEDQFKTL